MKILNLYAGIGGNRKLWKDVQVTAVEYDQSIADIYKDMYPQDTVICDDAHAYLPKHYQEFDFIWSSPPCPTHSQYRYNVGVLAKGFDAVYPDMTLYQEIIFIQYHFSGKWVVENVESYYEPLIKPMKVTRHFFWANFYIPEIKLESPKIRSEGMEYLQKHLGIDMSKYNHPEKRRMLRNCVNPLLGLHVLETSRRTPLAPDQPSAAGGQAHLFNLEDLQDVARFGTAGR
jgi:DNA (cytosine-5)-methyltransferase 1